jgi:benzoylformate decarboxylase
MEAFAAALAARLPQDALVFDEALTAAGPFNRAIPRSEPGSYFFTRGGSLGVGFPGAIGVSLANPGKLVIGLCGDGGTMYTPQALWTAKKYGARCLFVVCNNARYRLLDLNIGEYWREQGIAAHDFPSPFDIGQPALGFVDIARGMGVPGLRLERSDQIAPALDRALAEPGPFLIDLVLA